MAGSDSIVFLESFYEPMAANLARTRLEAAGIPCFLSNENLVSLLPLYSPITGGVRLYVRRSDAELALEILHDEPVPLATGPDIASFAADAPDPVTPRCPRCGSSNVAYGAATRNTYGFWESLLSVLLRFPVRGNRYHCFHCGNEFK
ncbi:putative signal transducing protein [Hymenobacter daeguensis]